MHLTVRADGGSDIGYGHLVRSGALVEEFLKNGHPVTCATTTPSEARSVYPEAIELLVLDQETEGDEFPKWVNENEPSVVVTDSYDIDTEYQKELAGAERNLVVVLDDTRHTICADIFVNGNVYAPGLSYDWIGTEPTWCLGTDFLLFRSEIRERSNETSPYRKHPQRAIVTMGGSDPRNSTPDVLRAFNDVDVTVDVIVGPGFRNQTGIERAAAETRCEFNLHEAPENLPELMFLADFAVSAAGSTLYELIALGTPTIGIPQADNQDPILTALAEREAMLPLPTIRNAELSALIRQLMSDSELRHTMRQSGKKLIDGRGTERLFEIIAENPKDGNRQ